MKVELELWHLLIMLGACVSAAWAGGRELLKQFEKRLDERFAEQERHRHERDTTRDAQRREDAAEHTAAVNRLDGDQRSLERAFLTFKAELPETYVRRDDHIRSQTVIEAKLDAVAAGLSEVRTLVARHE